MDTKTLTPVYEIWIEVRGECGTLIGESLIGLVFETDAGERREVLAAVPRPETKVKYRAVRRSK